MFSVYILLCSDGSYYVGQTHDLVARVKAHNAGTAASHTKERRPVRLVYSERHETLAGAVQRESQLKGWTRAKKEALVAGQLDRLHGLARRRRR